MTDTREATPRAALGQMPVHNGDGYSWGGDWIVTINQSAINFGGDPHLAALVVRAVNHFDEAVEVLGKSRKALEEAEAILGGEYGDRYGPLCEMMIDLVNSHNALLSKLEARHGSA